MPNTSQQLISDYVDWFKNKYSIKQLENADEIVTPFVNHLNDRIRLYIELKANNTIRISDDGNTFNELAMYGLDIKTNTRQKVIHNTLSNFGIQLDDDILYVEATIKDFPLKKHNLVQAILRIYDMVLLSKPNIISLFNEEAKQYLFDNELGGNFDIKMTGDSGLEHQIDYSLGPTKSRPEILIQFINNLSFGDVTKEGFIYDDLNKKRKTSKNQVRYILVANDIDNKIPDKAITAAQALEIDIQPWSKKEELLKLK